LGYTRASAATQFENENAEPMNKRSFLKICSALTGSHYLAPLLARADAEKLKNWAGNIEYGTENLYLVLCSMAILKVVLAANPRHGHGLS
jgi:hypothetical protein